MAVQAQIVNIPDSNFKAYLVGNSDINTNGDDEIQVSEAAAFSGSIYGKNEDISDLTGIEAFTALTYLDCSSNQLTSLDLSKNTKLLYLNCSRNQLTSLDISNNKRLMIFDCSYNKLTSLSASGDIFVRRFFCHHNQLTSLDLSNSKGLMFLDCSYNKLTSLVFFKSVFLRHLDCSDNKLTNIELYGSTNLLHLSCSNNQLTSLNLSKNTSLTSLECSKNWLRSINIANGNNENFRYFIDTIPPFNAQNNPNLKCIQIDDGFTPSENWKKDETTSWSNDIFYCEPNATDDLYSTESINIYPNPTTDIVTIKLNDEVKDKSLQILDLSGKIVLRKNISGNSTEIDVSVLEKGVYLIKVGGKMEKLIVI